MPTPGILMRMLHSKEPLNESSLDAPKVSSGIEAAYKLTALEKENPWLNTMYFLDDIAPLANSSASYDEDVKANASDSIPISWVLCAFINGRDQSTPSQQTYTTPHVPAATPNPGSVVIVNGSTPRADKEDDYHAWYDQEHGDKLKLVPGWNVARRYSLAKAYGNIETANFYGVNFYDEKNGLGGPEWKAGVTEWTLRIRDNAAKPNIRRQWKFVAAE
ncbi:hypothetical protein K491DRAFT_780143 [Lophiostoma macrostomum CBS 122681]|uniref:Uncharacterized protein n=1 Tax=Lophiostoma macrostomum CBS 122681 TaxID=1314788 RepID=A0A6A6T116_9PLEO|nr:hypothetical protein K491DRAFT_780143 [Lophiostoma macrostomum CBS 122681]